MLNSQQDGGYVSKIFGVSPYGSSRDRSNSFGQPGFASAEEAIAGGFTIDDRVLDRAECLLHVQ